MILAGQLDGRLSHFRAAALELHRRKVARSQFRQQVGKLDGDRVRAVHRRRKVQRIELPPDRLDDASIVVAYRDDVDARKRVQVPLAMDIPIMHAVGAGHDEWLLRPLGHLVANENLSEEGLFGRLSL